MKSLRALGPALALLLLGRCSSPTPVSDASVDLGADLGDTATPAVMDASDDRFDSGVAALREGEIPRTFRDETLPEFRVDLGAADLASLLVEGSTARVPMTLRYLGGAYRGPSDSAWATTRAAGRCGSFASTSPLRSPSRTATAPTASRPTAAAATCSTSGSPSA
nr:hypothetical protein [Deltaproteobacteria bacterium]